MKENRFLDQVEGIQSGLHSGVSALGLIQHILTEEIPPREEIEMLYVVYVYLQGVHQELLQFISSIYEEKR